ncbi:formylglycine-generating enzyme family protein [Aetokthonos hydrillicola CCALA 1050]|nr:formylglycine-generating enzyme family protein [Aetokthonos hydrillicola CCALA 1050]
MAILQMLPEWLWVRTALKQAAMAHFYAASPGVSNRELSSIRRVAIEDTEANTQKNEVKVPVFCLKPAMIFTWSQMVAGRGNVIVPGYIFRLDHRPIIPPRSVESVTQYTPEQQLQRFRVASSPMARRLASLLAASPTISLPVIRLIQETLLPKSMQVNVAEVLLGGILKPKEAPKIGQKPDEVEYRFVDPKIRSLLLESAPVPETVSVLSNYIEKKFQKSLEEFIAILKIWTQSEDEAKVEYSRPFAIVTAEVLKRKGGRYSEFVQEIERKFGTLELDAAKEFSDFEFTVATIIFEPDEIESQNFEFEVATIELKHSGLLRRKKELAINKRTQQSQYFIEDLGNGVLLEMVAIPEGSFIMGSPINELERSETESPQHEVTIKSFFLSKYPVTQAQWQAVASLPEVNRKLELNPSRFEGENRPVERVSWYDAVEFCERLSQHIGQTYRLPSEAEWEYACRAGTTTPFHFGETITSELANYNANYIYDTGVEGTYRKETTVVGGFGVANAFGLYDMHGNVWEWCLDDWHDDYNGAPTDGSPWFDDNNNLYEKRRTAVLRGGSWSFNPKYCRSAFRNVSDRVERDFIVSNIGFRVACGVVKILL